jgi:hypothetical protein
LSLIIAIPEELVKSLNAISVLLFLICSLAGAQERVQTFSGSMSYDLTNYGRGVLGRWRSGSGQYDVGHLEKLPFQGRFRTHTNDNGILVKLALKDLSMLKYDEIAEGHISWTHSDNDCLPGNFPVQARRTEEGYALYAIDSLNSWRLKDGYFGEIRFIADRAYLKFSKGLTTMKKGKAVDLYNYQYTCSWQFRDGFLGLIP